MLNPTPMEWLKRLKSGSGAASLREFAKECDTSHSRLSQLMNETDSSRANAFLSLLVKARRAGKASWEQLGNWLDDEYHPKK